MARPPNKAAAVDLEGVLPGGRRATLIASLPRPRSLRIPLVCRLDEVALEQSLFGAEAQLACVARLLAQSDRRLLFTQAPEAFFGRESLERVEHLAGRAGTIVHLRVGPARRARVLKGAVNVLVSVEDPGAPPLGRLLHPLAAGDCVPAAFQRRIAFFAGQKPMRRLAGGALETSVVPPKLLDAGFARLMPQLGRGWPPEVGVLSIAELLGPDFAGGPSISPLPSRVSAGDWRRELKGQPEGRPRIALPWNVAHPGSMVPDLLARFAQFAATAPCTLVLFPFNAADEHPPLRTMLSEALRKVDTKAGARERIFVAQASSAAGAGRIGPYCGLAWLDAGDPEFRWNLRCAEAMGLRAYALGARPGDDGGWRARAVPADETIEAQVSGDFGNLLVLVPTLSTRALAALLARCAAEAVREAPTARRPLAEMPA